MKNVDKHPEWLEPQEEADIIIIYKIKLEEVKLDGFSVPDELPF